MPAIIMPGGAPYGGGIIIPGGAPYGGGIIIPGIIMPCGGGGIAANS